MAAAATATASVRMADVIASLRREHFDQQIPQIVDKALEARDKDALEAAVAERVNAAMAPLTEAAAADAARIAELSARLDAVEEEQVAPLRAERDELAARVTELTAELASLQQQQQQQQDQQRDGDAPAATARDGSDALRTQHEELLVKLAEVTSANEALEARLAAADAAVEAAAAEREEAVAKATDALSAEARELRHARDEAVNDADEQRTVADVQSDKAARAIAELETTKARARALELRVAELSQQLHEARGEDDDDDEAPAGSTTLEPAAASAFPSKPAGAVVPPMSAANFQTHSPDSLHFSAPATPAEGSPSHLHQGRQRRQKRRDRPAGPGDEALSRLLGGASLEDGAKSVRAELLSFWRDGHDRISELERRCAELEERAAAGAVAEQQLQEQKKLVAQTVTAFNAVTEELGSVREESKRRAAQCVGLEAEAEALQTHLAAALGNQGSEVDIARCAAQFRDAATRAAQSRESVAHDPAHLRRAAAELEALKQDVASHQRQRAALEASITQQRSTLGVLNSAVASAKLSALAAGVNDNATTAATASTTATKPAAASAGHGLDAATLAIVTQVLHETLGKSDAEVKLARIADLTLAKKLRDDAAEVRLKLQDTIAERDSLRAAYDEATAAAEESKRHLTAALAHAKDELRAASAEVARLRGAEAAHAKSAEARGKTVAVLRSVVGVVAEQLRAATTAVAEARTDAFEARREAAQERASRDAAIRAALATLDNEPLTAALRRHAELMEAELGRIARHSDAASTSHRARLQEQLLHRTASLADALTKVRELSNANAATVAAKGESEAWCNAIDAVLAETKAQLQAAAASAAAPAQAFTQAFAAALRPAGTAAPTTQAAQPAMGMTVSDSHDGAEDVSGIFASSLLQSAESAVAAAESLAAADSSAS